MESNVSRQVDQEHNALNHQNDDRNCLGIPNVLKEVLPIALFSDTRFTVDSALPRECACWLRHHRHAKRIEDDGQDIENEANRQDKVGPAICITAPTSIGSQFSLKLDFRNVRHDEMK